MEWKISAEPVEYEDALSFMDERVADIHEGRAQECAWLLEHPALYTAGTSAKESDLLEARFPVFKTGRGGEYTYHGPGQRVAYVMLNLRARAQKQSCLSRESGNPVNVETDPRLRGENNGGKALPDVKAYVCNLEEWIIRSLAEFGIKGERREGRVGIWVGENKIAAIGVRIRRWVTLHGISINVNPDLSHFGGIVPCGISDAGVTSMTELLGRDVDMAELDEVLKAQWGGVFS